MNWTCPDTAVASFIAGIVVTCAIVAYLLRRKSDGPGVE